jgi:LysM repeat protein
MRLSHIHPCELNAYVVDATQSPIAGREFDLRIERQSFRVSTVVGESAGQSVVEGSVSLPVGAPEIGRLLRVRAHPVIIQYEVIEERVTLEGAVDVEALYASFTEVDSGGDEDLGADVVLEERLEIGRWNRAMPFTLVLDITGAEPGLPAKVAVSVDSIRSEVQDDKRSIAVDVALAFSGAVHRVDEHTLTTRAVADYDIRSEQRQVRLPLATTTVKGQARVEGFLPFGGRVLPHQVLSLTIRPAGEPTVRFSEGTAEVSSALDCAVLYTASEVGAAYVEWPEGLTFLTTVSMPEPVDGAMVSVAFTTADVRWQAVDTDERRGLAVEATAFADVQVAPMRETAILTDLSAEEPLCVAARKEWLLLQEAVGEGRQHTLTEASLQLPAGALPVERVLLSEATARIEDIHVLGDKVAVEGIAGVDLVYVGRSGDATSLTTCSWPAGIPFELEVPIAGAEPGLERKVEVSVDKVSVDLINRETVAVELDLVTTVALSRSIELDHVVEAVEVGAPHPNPPTYTFLVLQAGDTLWQIAQRYHTEIGAIIQGNKWLEDESSPLPPGTKLCIPRGRQTVG